MLRDTRKSCTQRISPLTANLIKGLRCGALALPALLLAAGIQAQAARQFQVPAGDLGAALTRFAAESGAVVYFDAQVTKGLKTRGLAGEYGIQEGLAQLVSGSGLQVVREADGSFRVVAGPQGALPAVKVTAEGGGESGTGPVEGYAAKRSITATKTDIPLIETPQAVSIVTADQIAIQNAESLAQAFKYTPGIVPMGSDNATSDGMVIRGFNVTGAAPMYLNGTKLSRNTFSGVSEPFAMERIEILKGPASVLYGNAAPGGIINMVSKQPRAEKLRELQVQAGTYDRMQVAGDFAGAITDDGAFSYRALGMVRRSDTMVDHIPDDREFGALSVRWQPGDRTSLTLFANYQHNDVIYNYGLPQQGTVVGNPNGTVPQHRFVGEPGFDRFDTENHTLGYLFSHQFSDRVTFRQNVLWFEAEVVERVVSTSALDAATQRLLSRGAYARDTDDSSVSLDNQLEIKWQSAIGEHTSLIGVDYVETDFKRINYNGTVAALDIFNPLYGAPVTLNATPSSYSASNDEQLGIYLQEHLKIAERWVAMVGGRYDKVESSAENYLTGVTTTPYDDSAFTGRAGVVYLFDNGFAPYVSYAESFQPASGQDINGNPFEPTEGEQFEAGIRYQPEGEAVSVTASVYQLTQTNVTTADLANPGFSIQEGEVESKGVEVEARANLSNGLSLIASYGYIDNAVTKSNSGNEGNRSGGVARNMASLWADYRFSGHLAGLTTGAGVRYVGSSPNLANTYEADAYTVVDAVVSYSATPQWLFSLNLTNLFDEQYATCTYACFYGVSRSAVMAVRYRW